MLSHYARLIPWIPFYKETLNDKGFPKKTKYRSEFSPKFSIEVAKDLFLKTDFEKEIYDQIRTSELVDSLAYLYSDLPYYILKKYFESSFNKSYDKLVEEKVFNPLGLKEITYSPLNKFDTIKIVPSEIDDYFRNQKLDGYQQVVTDHELKTLEKSKVAKELGKLTKSLKLSRSIVSNKSLSFRVLAQVASSVPKRVRFTKILKYTNFFFDFSSLLVVLWRPLASLGLPLVSLGRSLGPLLGFPWGPLSLPEPPLGPVSYTHLTLPTKA